MGRPHPPRSTVPQSKPGITRASPERQPVGGPGDGSLEAESPSEVRKSLEHETCEKSSNSFQGSENDLHNDVVLNFRGSMMLPNGQMTSPHTDHYMMKQLPHVGRKGHGEDTAMFNFDDGVKGANSIGVDASDYQAMLNDNIHVHTSNHSSTSGSIYQSSSGLSAYGESSSSSSTSNTSESDCATVAMNMLQHLNTTSMQQPSSATSAGEPEAPAIDALINTVSMAIKRVSTILVCPCSQRTDVGLLAAAVCAAILDIYGNIFHNSVGSDAQCSSTNKPTYTTMFAGDDGTRDVDKIDMCTESLQHGPMAQATIMRVLKELSKVANLVMQFTKRYNQDAKDCSPDFLPALAASLKSRLKSMTNEATNWLAQV